MTSAERLCMVSARSEALLADFVLLFLIRWGLKYLGISYVYYQPVLSEAAPPLYLADVINYPASSIFYGTMFFLSGLPELLLAGMWIIYAFVTLSLFGRTLGMWQAGIVLRTVDGKRPGIVRVLVRQIVAPLSSVAWIGYWPMAFSRQASALHDIISGTRMEYVERSDSG